MAALSTGYSVNDWEGSQERDWVYGIRKACTDTALSYDRAIQSSVGVELCPPTALLR
jgi:hypothetical protein